MEVKCIELTYNYSMAKHQNVIERSATGGHPIKQSSKYREVN